MLLIVLSVLLAMHVLNQHQIHRNVLEVGKSFFMNIRLACVASSHCIFCVACSSVDFTNIGFKSLKDKSGVGIIVDYLRY